MVTALAVGIFFSVPVLATDEREILGVINEWNDPEMKPSYLCPPIRTLAA
jgi:hypothetical protein